MAFADEIIKAKRKVIPYLRFARLLNPEPWAGPDERLYGHSFEGSAETPIKGHVLSFGNFNRSLANQLFSVEIPGLTVSLMDPDYDWRVYANEPYDTLLRKWIHLLLRVYDDSDYPMDATVALGLIQSVSYPAGRKVSLNATVTSPEVLSARIPQRVITRDDWPNAPMEAVGRAVPIVYGKVSNAVVTDASIEEIEIPSCCPEFTPAPSSQERNADIPALRWSDYFTGRMGYGAYPDDFYSYPNIYETDGPAPDAWLDQNYVMIGDIDIEPGAGEFGGNALKTSQGYGEITRPVGPSQFVALEGYYPNNQAWPVPDSETGESWDHPSPMAGRTPGQYGSAGFRRKMIAEGAQNQDWPVAIEVWGYPGAPSYILSLGVWGNEGDDTARHLWLYVGGTVGRRNGAYIQWLGPGTTNADDQLDPPGEINGVPQGPPTGGIEWTTAAMQNCLLSNQWQTVEMKWKFSSLIDPYNTGDASTDVGTIYTATVANDGYVVVRVDGQVVMHLQDIQFYHPSIPKERHWASYIYWYGVAFRPQGYCSCLYVTDRALFCDEAQPVQVESPVPCTENAVAAGSAGALPAILVDSTETTTTSLQRVTGPATGTNSDPAPTNVIGYTGVGYGAVIGPGDACYYRIAGVKNGVETSLSEQVQCVNAEIHYDRIEWDEPPQGPMDSYRVYQYRSADLSFHPDIPGFPREETYWVRSVAGDQEPGGRDPVTPGPSRHWIEYSLPNEGTPYSAAKSVTNVSYDNVYVIAGHAGDASQGDGGVLDVFAPLPGLRENIGGLNLLTGEKEPITFEQTAARLTRLSPGADYWTEVVEKPSGRFTVIHVTRLLRDINTCAFPPVSVNFAGITYNADGSGGLISDGIHIFRHFLLNWVFNSYATGEWFTDVVHSPGIVDVASFDTASAVATEHFGGPLQGAVAMLSQADARQYISEAITTFGLNFFYRNAASTGWGAWAVSLTDTRWSAAGSWPQFGPNESMVEETFQSAITMDLLANVVHYKAGPNLNAGSLNGWLISGTIEDTNSSARVWGKVAKDLILPWTRDQATAVFIAGQYLDLCAFPAVAGSFQTKGRGIVVQPGDFVSLAHPDAPGLGWLTRTALIVGHDLDIDNGIVTLRFLSTPSMID
jgi:hypothetical protein